MRSTGWIGLSVIAMGAAFAAGLAAGRAKKPEQPPAREVTKVEADKPKARDDSVLIASLEKFRVALGEKEERIAELERQLAEVSSKLPAPLSPEEEKRRKEEEERRRKSERWTALYEKSKPLRAKILQRRDKALREKGLTEVATLIQSGKAEEMLLGLMTLSNLWAFNLDKERFRPDVVEALRSEDAEVRQAALNCVNHLCSGEEQLRIALSMVSDPSHEIRMYAVPRLASLGGPERKEEVASALKALLQDKDKSVRNQAASQLRQEWGAGYDYGAELEDIMVELSRDEETRDAARRWLFERRPVTLRIAQLAVETYDQDQDEGAYHAVELATHDLSEEAKPVVRDFLLRVTRESIEPWQRWRALDKLTEMGDPSVITQLDEIARSPDAEGIEERLARTIEGLRQKEIQQR